MAVTVDEIKKLRDMTNAGMMDCKNALEKSNGSIDEALKYLKEKGLADAKKRSDRETKEGGVFIRQKGDKIAIIQLGCETDFVSSNEIFVKSKEKILDMIIESGNDKTDSYKDIVQEIITQTKENVEFKNAKFFQLKSSQFCAAYIHGNNKIGVIAVFDDVTGSVKDNPKFKEMTNNICLHIAANQPYYMTEKEIPLKEIEEQKDIMKKQMEGTNKPADVINKIIEGKLTKYYSDICLLHQKFVKDDKLTVTKYLENAGKELGTAIKLISFIRFMIGK